MPESVLPATARALLARTARVQRDGRAPSLVAGVVRDGGLAWSAGRGDVAGPHTDVQYRLGSISKTVTAVAVLRLRDEGRLHLDDPLDRHVPGTPLGDRSVGQLLSHLAGASAESPGGWWERVPGGSLEDLALGGEDVVLGEARRFHYSNLGFGLLGELVARLRGRSWDDVVTGEVLLPLGMTRTTPRPSGRAAQGYAVHPWADVVLAEPEHHAGVMAAAGQLWATLADLARFAAFLLGDTGDVLDPGTLEEMAVPAGVDPSSPAWSAYGLGLQVLRVDGRTLTGHGGSMPGFLAGVLVDREEGTGGVSLANTTSGLDPGLVPGLLADLRAAEPRVAEPWRPSPPPVPLDQLGVWYWGPAPSLLRAVAGGLLHLGPLPGRPGRASRFRGRDDGTWVGLDGYYAGEVLRIAPDHLDLGTFVLTREPYDPDAPVPGGVDERGWTSPDS
ncbi:CubicO group peptidase, beta-lactamase class C family [Geodermatophilus obscurus]|uniref:CubicO group peptidase, beta-lactamase class C family n=1 Tax=Geodermatophilus obscurus TaxID=1861 RepID=A0A1I5GEL7_9ACTN|nr:serine hydrolase domain-containing protein [Geodermatophilus obscurus]SFO34303.1 CubicO group peptidase, beta-lactamase class C family [Geodermatophilus obscurus]